MIYAICGPMSLHFKLITDFTRFLLERFHGSIEFCYFNTVDDFRRLMSARDKDAPCLMCFNCPEEIICQLIERTGVPTVLVAEPFSAIHAFALHHHSSEFFPSAHEVTRTLSALNGLARLPNVMAIRVSDEEKLNRLAARIAEYLHLSMSNEDLEETVRIYCRGDAAATILSASNLVWGEASDIRQTIRNYSAEERTILENLAKYYDPMLSAEPVETVSWPLEALINAESQSPLSGPISLTGPGRILTFGPYMYLPKGNWKATVTFAVKENYSGNRIVLDVFIPETNTLAVFAAGDMPVGGVFATSVEFFVETALHAIELRLYTQFGAIEGEIHIFDVTVSRIASAQVVW